MWGARAFIVLGAALLVAASCAVSGFEKIDALPGSDASAGSGGSAGSAGSATTGGSAGVAGTDGGGAGGSAGGVQCTLSTCSPGTNAEPCCFTTSTASVCGLIASEYAVCVPPNGAGAEDAGCATKTVGGKTLSGCCMTNGLCGYLDADHDLGCMPVEAFGDPPQACADSACGELCVGAKAAQCWTGELGAYECAEACLGRPATCADELKAVTDCASAVATQCADHGDPLFSECLAEQLEVAECEKWPGDCNLYCAMVQTACTGQNVKQYDSEEQCRAVCKKLTLSTHAITQDLTNSVVCRAQNAALALTGSTTELCPAAGPGGSKPTGPACGGGDCQTYCKLFSATCPDQFTQDYANSLGDCEAACAGATVPNTPPYDVGDQSGNTVQCRLYWTVQAIADTANTAAHCEKARKTSTQCQ